MQCEKCGVSIAAGEERKHYGRLLCEDCYMDLLSPAKACDPWAVYSAKMTTQNQAGEAPLKPVQQEILALLQKEGPMDPDALSSRLHLKAADLDHELATLRHMEKIRGELKNGLRMIRLWDNPSA